jgi:diadenosine tetraphosphate (Ap4A) HIT family hydrolase
MSWKDSKKWEAMKTGESCAFCHDIHLDINQFSFKVIEFDNSFVRLPKNQYWQGWTIVALKRHATELYELTEKELAEFWQEVSLTAKAINQIFKPVKINYAIYGNLCPHIHCHIFPQQIENDPHAPIKQDAEELILTDAEYQTIIEKLREQLK